MVAQCSTVTHQISVRYTQERVYENTRKKKTKVNAYRELRDGDHLLDLSQWEET